MIKTFFVFISLINLCKTQSYFSDHGIIGLSTLIQLSTQTTEIVISDYFFEGVPVLERIPGGVSVEYNYPFLKINGKMNRMVDYFLFRLNEKSYAIPVRNSKEIPVTFTFKPEKTYKNLKIKGNFNNWDIHKNPLEFKDGVYSFSTYLNPGRYEYVFVEDGKEFPDPTNPKTISNGIGGTNSIWEVGDLKAKPPRIQTDKIVDNQVFLTFDGYISDVVVMIDNSVLDETFISLQSNGFSVTIPTDYASAPKSYLRVYAANEKLAANDLVVPLSFGKVITDASKLDRLEPRTQIMYSLMVDRFKDGNQKNNRPLRDKSVLWANNYQGGDLEGIIQKIKDGYFQKLGVNTLWISPIVQNPNKAYGLFDKDGVRTRFSGYHGYWPISSSKIEPRFGNDGDLVTLTELAHKNQMNVLLDYVANHVHEEHPLLKKHPDWKTPLDLPDGRKNIRLWDEHRLTTWFDPFMPTLDLERQDVTEVMSDSAVYWYKKFNIDGFRHDATKHIPTNFWRTLTKKLKLEWLKSKDRRLLYQIGETYGGNDLIASYVNNGMLDGQFDFSLYHHLTHCLIQPDVPMENLKLSLEESLYYYGNHHLMGNISGNHDKARIISYADGSVRFDEDAQLAGYKRKITNRGERGFKIVGQIMAFNFTIPGIPVIYYGDEIGMPGGNDPDCRRMMQFDKLKPEQIRLRDEVSRLAKLRRSSMALLFGSTEIFSPDALTLVVVRSYFGEHVALILNSLSKKRKIQLPEELEEKFQKATLFKQPEESISKEGIWVDGNSYEIGISKSS